jgi:hypothetical protein
MDDPAMDTTITGLAQASKASLRDLCLHLGLSVAGTRRDMARAVVEVVITVPPSAASGLKLGWAFFVFVVVPSISRVVFLFRRALPKPRRGFGLVFP